MHSRINLAVSIVLAVVFMLLAWFRSDRTNRGPVRRSRGRRILLTLGYSIAFLAGEVYLIVWITDLRWSRALLFLAQASWGVLLGSGVWYRHLRKTGTPEPVEQ